MSEIMSVEDQARIELTLQTRERIVRSLTKDNSIPADTNDRAFLLSALDGLDRTILSRAKIKSDDTNAKSEAEMAKTMASLLMRMDSKRRSGVNILDVDGVFLPEITLVDGETFIGVEPIKSADIMKDSL